MRKFTSVLLALVLCAALLCIGAAAADSEDASQFAGGDGTPENPYQIENADQLKAVEDNLSANYILTADINLGGETNPWNPIGTFTGTFDGAGHTISGLYIAGDSSADGNDQGLSLFSYLSSGGTIENLTVKGDIYPENSGRPVGGVAGKCSGGTISNCTSGVNINGETVATVGGVVGNAEVGSTIDNCRYTGTIDITIDLNVMGMGGVVGMANDCTISNCENAGTVKSNIWKGGIVGRNNGGAQVLNCRNSGIVASNALEPGAGIGGIVGENYGVILDSYNAGTVTGGACTGGVVGFNVAEDSNSTSGTIENCYNAGTVSGSGDVGGVAGYNNSSSATYTATIKSSYNTGTVINDGSGNVGGVVGWNEDRNDSSGIVTGCFYLKQGELKGIGYGDDSGNGARELTEDEFADPENFPGWNFTNTWIIDTPSEGGFARPMLRYNLETAEGSGMESDPYIIPDLETLAFYRDMINTGSDSKYNSAHYKLTVDINLDGSEDNQWEPIGGSKNRAFTGTFDGDGHTISGLYINNGDSVYAGLFGYVGRGGMIKGLTVEGEITVSGSTSCVGGIAGIVSSSGQVGMSVLTDSNDSKMGIIDCTSKVTINVTYNGSNSLNVGGIAGRCGGATISGCENYGAVSAEDARGEAFEIVVGGIVGYSRSSTIIRNCCNTGAVSAQNAEDAALGGVVGYNYDDESTVSNCYNIGDVSAEDVQGVNVGGVVGEN